jgi:hypothetical protein
MDAVQNELVVLLEEIQPPAVPIDWEQMKRIAAIVAGHPSTVLPVLRPLYDMHRSHETIHPRASGCVRCDRIGWLLKELEGMVAKSLPSASWDDEEEAFISKSVCLRS